MNIWGNREAAQMDEALERARAGEPLAHIARDLPTSADLLPVVRMIESLAPTPAPRLAEGRRRFLNAAQITPPRLARAPAYRVSLTFALVCIGVLLMGALFVMLSQPSPTPTTSPTFTITPIKTAMAPRHALVAPFIPPPKPEITLPKPQPVPTPAPVFYD